MHKIKNPQLYLRKSTELAGKKNFKFECRFVKESRRQAKTGNIKNALVGPNVTQQKGAINEQRGNFNKNSHVKIFEI